MPGGSVERDLATRLDALRRELGDTVHMEQVAGIVQEMLANASSIIDDASLKLYHEIEGLAQYIHQAKSEIAALRPHDIQDRFIASATDELDAIVEATETATNGILDAAEKIEAISGDVSPEVSERLTEITTQIYEACNFQDITGQRITKVVRALKDIEERVGALVIAFGAQPTPAAAADHAEPKPLTDADLLNGPQLPNKASRQDEIDALLAGS